MSAKNASPLFQENQVIHGKCGGYCGTCVPEHHNGLKLDLMPPPIN